MESLGRSVGLGQSFGSQATPLTRSSALPPGGDAYTGPVTPEEGVAPLTGTVRDNVGQPFDTGVMGRLGHGAISAYQWVTRQTPLQSWYQEHRGKCSHRTIGQTPLSCSDYALKAWELYPWKVALFHTILILQGCNPIFELGPLNQVFEDPLPPKVLMEKVSNLAKGRPLVYTGTLEDWQKALSTAEKDIPAQLPPADSPARNALINLSRWDWLRAAKWDDEHSAFQYEKGKPPHPPQFYTVPEGYSEFLAEYQAEHPGKHRHNPLKSAAGAVRPKVA